MMTGIVQDQNLEKQIEKQMGCMAGFFQLFDRHQLLTSKKIHSSKRLPPPKVVDATNGSEESAATSPAISRELGKPQSAANPPATPSPEKREHKLPLPELRSPELLPPKSPLPLPIFELKEGTRLSWKFSKEAPRLSLDSRATADSKGNLHPRGIRTKDPVLTTNRGRDADVKQPRSPRVIARLMGLEPLPDSNPEPAKDVELTRSASESRVSRDLFQYPSIESNNSQLKQPNQSHLTAKNVTENTCSFTNARPVDHSNLYSLKNDGDGDNSKSLQPKLANRAMVSSPWKAPPHRKSFFDIADVFPEPKQEAISMYSDIEKRLKMRGIHEPLKDLDTLKQILDSLQLKGLLHSKRPSEQRNFIYDFPSDESSIVVMRPSKSPAISRRMGNDSPTSSSRYGVRRNSNFPGDYSPSISPRRERPVTDRNVRSPTKTRSWSNPRRSSNSIVKPKSLNVETQRRAANESMDSRRVSPIQSPKLTSRTNKSSSSLPDQTMTTNRSPRNRRSTAEIYQREKIITTVVTEDESSSISESTFSTSSQTDAERWKMEDHREGKNLLERCDKLLHSIAEMNTTDNMQPSPVSVLDSSSFYKDESSSSSSPSPVVKRRQRDCEFDEETWSSIFMPPAVSKLENVNEDSDFVYISEILMATHYLPEDSDVFLQLEKQQYLKGKDTSEVSRVERRLNFDIIAEILERKSQLPPWKAFSLTDSVTVKSSVRKVWSEFQRIRDRGRERETTADDLFEIVCGVLKKDLAEDAFNGWGDCPVELSEAVLDIERLIFKDLMGEAIRDLAAFACKNTVSTAPRRKLIF